MPERELADLNRNGKRCMSPCSQTYYNVEASYLPKDQLIVSSNKVHLKPIFFLPRVVEYEYGYKEDWVYAVTFLYKTLLQEER